MRGLEIQRERELERGQAPQHETPNNGNRIVEYTYNGAGQRIMERLRDGSQITFKNRVVANHLSD